MRFELSQDLPAPAGIAIEVFADPDFHRGLTGLTKVSTPEVLDHEATGDLIRLRMRYRFVASLPGAVTAVVDPERLTWVDETTYDLGGGTAVTVMHPDHYSDRLSAEIRTEFLDAPGGCTRLITGNLRVKVLLVAGQVERAIVSGLEEHMTEEGAAARVRLSSG